MLVYKGKNGFFWVDQTLFNEYNLLKMSEFSVYYYKLYFQGENIVRKALTTIISICLVAVLFCVPAFATGFNDTSDHWAEDSIARWVESGIIEGVGDGSFDPDATMTRAQAAAMFARLLKLDTEADISGFSDVNPDAWYAEYIAKCVAAGIMNGVGGDMMDPNGTLTGEQMMVMLCRALGIEPETTTETETTGVSDWAAGYVGALVTAGIVDADSTTPTAEIDRAATMSLLDKSIAGYASEEGETITVEEGKTGVVLVVAENVTVEDAPEGSLVITGAAVTETTVNGETVSGDTVHEVGGDNTDTEDDTNDDTDEPTVDPEDPEVDPDQGDNEEPEVHVHGYAPAYSNGDGSHSRKCSCGVVEGSGCTYVDGLCSECGFLEDAAAMIGDTRYATLEESIAAVKDGETIQLLKDNTETGIVVNRVICFFIDGAGYAYTPSEITTGDCLACRVSGSPYEEYLAVFDFYFEHIYTYTANEDDTHDGACTCGSAPITGEACTYVEGVCSACGYIDGAEAKIGTTYYATLAEAVTAGGTVTVLNDTTIDEAIVITSNTTLVLNGNTVTVGAISGGDRPFNIEANNVSFTIDATAAGSSINYGSSNYGFVEVGNRSTNPTVTDIKITVNGGTYTGGSTGGAIFRFRGDSTASLTLNNVTWTDSATGTYGAITDVNNSPDIAVVSITVNGGTFTTNSGFCATAPSSFTGATINTKGYGIEVGSSTATVSGCTITVDPGIVHGTAPAACVAAAGGANITVSNSTLEVISGIYCLETYPSGGHITANNCTFTGSVSHMYAIDETNYPGATCSITVNNPVFYAPSNTGELMTLLQTVADGSTILLAPVNYSTDYAVTLGGGHFNETLPKNITIIGNANATIDFAVNKSNGSIPFDGAMDGWVFKNVNFVGSGFRLQNGATATNIRLEGCTFTGGATFYSLAASGGYVSGATIYDCEFYDTVNSGVNKNAISIQDARNIKIEACTFSNVRNAINFGSSATGNMVITGNTVIGTTDRVLRITDGGATYTITSNTITSCGEGEGQVIRISDVTAENVTLSANSWNGHADGELGYDNGTWSLPTNTAN